MSMDPGEWTEGLRKEYLHLIDGFFSIPLPFSFTTYGRALQASASALLCLSQSLNIFSILCLFL